MPEWNKTTACVLRRLRRVSLPTEQWRPTAHEEACVDQVWLFVGVQRGGWDAKQNWNFVERKLRTGVRERLRQLFADDAFALDASRAKLRDEFLAHRGATDAGDIDTLLAGAAEVEGLLVNNVVQGRQQEDSGAFKFKVRGDASADDEFAHRAEPIDDLEISLAEAELRSKEGKGIK